MTNSFRQQLQEPDRFVVTLELVPGPESRGRSVDNVTALAEDARKDGRIAAVSITDNPGGNPSLSPDILGQEIQAAGMDVIVHCTCRDQNRAGLESRALQLARMDLRTILALTGDYSNSGFGGQGLPVFDLDSVTLLCLLRALGRRLGQQEPPVEPFFTGCAVSPFKQTEAECFAQYAKLRLKAAVGARFVITQLGYDARKFQEVLQMQREMALNLPTLGTVFVLTPGAARIMNGGKIPGAVVTDPLLASIQEQGKDRDAALEQAARLAAVLKGLGYRGVHLGGIHRSFESVDRILTRLEEIQDQWRDFLPDFDYPQRDGYYCFEKAAPQDALSSDLPAPRTTGASPGERITFAMMDKMHNAFFRADAPLANHFARMAQILDKTKPGRTAVHAVEDPVKFLLLRCKQCGDCAIQHVGYLCPESQCPKHIRNGPCGGSHKGMCEVYPDRPCVWVRCYRRLASANRLDTLQRQCVPPRMWRLNQTSSWLNFHLRRDHQSLPCEIACLFHPSGRPCPCNDAEQDDR